MDRVSEYLLIPEEYAAPLGGLHWSASGEAIDRGDGSTFAFAGEIVGFVEGFAAQRPLVHFTHILHLLYLLRRDLYAAPRDERTALREAFRKAGQLHRNAGAFCAVLCGDVPAVPDPPTAWHVWQRVVLRSYTTADGFGLSPGGVVPPLTPAVFEARVLQAASGYTPDELLHWFSHGCGPLKGAGDKLARELLARKPRSLEGVLTDLTRSERLSGVMPFVAQLVSALTLPPRRLAQQELPLGGYADVTTRGHPEGILPSQFALDELEFVRRHAENELLYFRREEPQARTRESLLLLLDQGVRTWGDVRLVLTAAVIALARFAEARRRPFLLACTSNGGPGQDPLALESPALQGMLEASDLSPTPGLALERVLEDAATPGRDIVLLTHPRSLAEDDVASAARRLRRGERLFAVTVDGRGDVEFSEVRHGVAVPRSRFHVEPERAATPPQPTAAEPDAPWRGDVEPVGFPFRFGVGVREQPFHFAFDRAGDFLLTATHNGVLHLTRTDGSRTEVLPRGMVDSRLLTDVQAVLGVAGGFVVCGAVGGPGVAVHYDLGSRTVRAHRFRNAPTREDLRQQYAVWWYLRNLHTIVVRLPGGV
jgi:hypothetical protein